MSCKQSFTREFLDCPDLVRPVDLRNIKWCYEGNSGYWLFDPETAEQLDEAFRNSADCYNAYISGKEYVVDFRSLQQWRKDNPNAKRKIAKCRDVDKKKLIGVAGVSKKIIFRASKRAGHVYLPRKRPSESASTSSAPDDGVGHDSDENYSEDADLPFDTMPVEAIIDTQSAERDDLDALESQ